MRPKSMILLLLALGCGLVASVGISQVMDQNKSAPAAMEMEDILVASKDLEGLKTVAVENVKLEKWPKDKVPKGALKELADVEGRSPKALIVAGEAILDGKLLKPGERVVASQDIPKGFRVIGVKVEAATSGGSLLMPGDKVDVVVFLEDRSAAEKRVTARTILQNVKVFAVNQVYNAEQAVGGGEEGSNTIAAKTVSLLVKLEQAEKLTLAEQLGKIELVIRGPEDDEVGESDGADVAGLFSRGFDLLGNKEPAEKEENKGTGLFQFLTAQNTQADPVATVVDADLEPDWTMTLFEGTSRYEARFKDGKLMPEPEAVAAVAPSTATPEGAAAGTQTPGAPAIPGFPAGTEPAQGASAPAIPDLDKLFGSES